MKTNNTPEQVKRLAEVLRDGLHAKLFCQESGDPKRNAQMNLRGRTHYVDDDTLRWHKSRVCSTAALHCGLLFSVTCSDALDMNNIKRGFRSVVFDVFGTIVQRPELEAAASTSAAAIKARDAQTVDLMKHYRDAITRLKLDRERDSADFEKALAELV